ncbi:hypothetical protein L915_16425 [Phytophthora nicotianae]|uniref:Uncharacterized protein n=1 Tax=Phytophthora nicotianae TaxID=4792 RepID=W2G2Y7_PHYNI|nr:hypothetical protein L915_16425 [Phytophthora nicotianae]ETL30746.1 hypothetical protein L916_16320 [Phytophthora nicotianae]
MTYSKAAFTRATSLFSTSVKSSVKLDISFRLDKNICKLHYHTDLKNNDDSV